MIFQDIKIKEMTHVVNLSALKILPKILAKFLKSLHTNCSTIWFKQRDFGYKNSITETKEKNNQNFTRIHQKKRRFFDLQTWDSWPKTKPKSRGRRILWLRHIEVTWSIYNIWCFSRRNLLLTSALNESFILHTKYRFWYLQR